MGNGMNKIIPGLYVGNFRDSKDPEQLEKYKITHILSIHDNAKKILEDKEYLCIVASDTPDQTLTKFFPQCIDFIHEARLKGGNVIVHCIAGVSRSVTVTAAYIMTVTSFGWRDALNAIRGARSCANPNFGFQRQLQQFETDLVEKERKRVKEKYDPSPYDDEMECRALLTAFKKFVLYGDTKDKDDGLYPLPPNAYKSRDKSPPKDSHKDDKSKTTNYTKYAEKAAVQKKLS
ncbi:dual specificity protein phosphatase 22-like [Pecten maximus]|uniref:dual specificity protein phosphatase 22-like n=1 Tax=Pecten maximus TaxID=6579 RepID=UPI001458F150|nr:dual specificity protein phosphatase 22-like [Pecten maximus]